MTLPLALPLEQMRRCAGNRRFLAAVEGLYGELEATIAARAPLCLNRGSCCRFGQFGHRLYVTPAELAYFEAGVAGAISGPTSRGEGEACPYQQGGGCTARASRPSGCRIFFCDPASRAWQGPLTEQTLAALKVLHERFRLPYAYLDWMEALALLAEV